MKGIINSFLMKSFYKWIIKTLIKIWKFCYSTFSNTSRSNVCHMQNSCRHGIPLRESQATSAKSSRFHNDLSNANSYTLRLFTRIPNTITMQKYQPYCIRYKCNSTSRHDYISTKSEPQYTFTLYHFSQSWCVTGMYHSNLCKRNCIKYLCIISCLLERIDR